MSQWKRNKNHRGRSGPAHWVPCLLALLMLAGGVLGSSAYAAGDGLGVDDNTYALVVTTGAATPVGDLSKEIQYFKIIYEDVDGYTRSHRIFPGEDSVQESLEMARSSEIASAEPLTSDEQWLMRYIQQKSSRDFESMQKLLRQLYPDTYQQFSLQYGVTAKDAWYSAAEAEILPKLEKKQTLYEYASRKNPTQPLNETRRKYAEQLGYPVQDIEDQKAFEAYATDTFFFQPLKKVKTIKRVEFLTKKGGEEEAVSESGTWNCQSLRIYQVDAIYGLGMYGYISNRQYADFDGTLLLEMDRPASGGGVSFSWPVDRMQRIAPKDDRYITSDGKTQYTPDATLSLVNEPYSTKTTDYVFRLDIADAYGAGIEMLANKSGMGILDSKFVEAAALELKYLDIYGSVQYARVPLVAGILGYAMEKGVSPTEKLSGIAQQGDTLALAVSLPDFASFADGEDAIRLLYGTQIAEETTGISYTGGSTAHAAREVIAAGKQSGNADTLSLIGVSIYDPTVTDVEIKVEGTMLRPAFKGQPIRYFRAPTTMGVSIDPVSSYVSGWTVSMTEYENGTAFLPKEQEERYLVVLKTDDQAFAATTGDLQMTLHYVDLSGNKLSSDTFLVADCVNAYYGYWPGVSRDFAYRAGMNAGKELNCVVSLRDVDKFTGITFRVAGSDDDWQIKGIEILRLTDMGVRTAEWKTVTGGNETSDREYSRDCRTTASTILNLNRQVLIGTGDEQELQFNSESTIEVQENSNWSEYRYSMDYEQTQKLGSFTKARYNYTVAVKVADDVVSSYQDGDCGSKNQFYFLLVFQNGSSGYVLANQQLSSDGFRTGYEETFTISINRDMGDLTAVRILPEDLSDKSDVFDKLKIDEIRVRKQGTGPSCQQWVIEDVGWIDIDYRDEAEGVSMTGRAGRSEEELSKAYRVDYSTNVVNLQFAITTADYAEKDAQFEGQMMGELMYYDSKGQFQRMTFDAVRAMYDYMEKRAVIAESSSDVATQGNAISDKDTMFRANHTDRFILSVNDVSQLVGIILKVKSSVVTTWNIKEVSVALTGMDGELLINANNEYELVGATEQQPLCTHANAGGIPYTKYCPKGQDNEINIYFTENKIEQDAPNTNLISAVSRVPQSVNDTMNIYVYMDENSPAMSEYTLDAAVQYSKIYEGTYQTAVQLTPSSDGDNRVQYAIGVDASGMSTLNKLWLQATLHNGRSVELVEVDHAIVQQVRSGVVIDTYYLDFNGRDASLVGISATPGVQNEGVVSKQVVTLSFGEGTKDTWLIQEEHDVAVALEYTTTAGSTGADSVYASPYIYLTDQNWKELRSGRSVSIVFEQSYVKEVTGISLVGTGNMVAEVDKATVALYEVNETAKTEVCTGWFSFGEGITLGPAAKTMQCTSTGTAGSGTIKHLTLSFTTPEVGESGNAVRNITGTVGMTLSYTDANGVERTETVPDIRQYMVDGNGDFAAGSTMTARLLLPGCRELRWISLDPRDESGAPANLKLSALSAKLQAGGEETVYMRDLKDWTSDQPIDLYHTTVAVTASTHSVSTGTDTVKSAENDTLHLLVESGQAVNITVKVDGSREGYRCKAEEVTAGSADYTKDADSFLTKSGDSLVFTPPVHYGNSEVYYRITIWAEEVPMVRCVVELAVQPGEKPEPEIQEKPVAGGDPAAAGDPAATNTPGAAAEPSSPGESTEAG